MTRGLSPCISTIGSRFCRFEDMFANAIPAYRALSVPVSDAASINGGSPPSLAINTWLFGSQAKFVILIAAYLLTTSSLSVNAAIRGVSDPCCANFGMFVGCVDILHKHMTAYFRMRGDSFFSSPFNSGIAPFSTTDVWMSLWAERR